MLNKDPFTILTSFFDQFKTRSYRKRQIILRSGIAPSGVFYLRKGYVRQFILSSADQELTTIIYKPGDVFPMLWVINNDASDRYFETVTPSQMSVAPRGAFLAFIEGEPSVSLKLFSRILNRIHALSERMEYLAFGNARVKVASILLLCVERFGQKQKGGAYMIGFPLTHKDIASLLGVTRETVSLEMKKLAKKGIITHKNHFIIVKNMKALNRESLLEKVS